MVLWWYNPNAQLRRLCVLCRDAMKRGLESDTFWCRCGYKHESTQKRDHESGLVTLFGDISEAFGGACVNVSACLSAWRDPTEACWKRLQVVNTTSLEVDGAREQLRPLTP